MPVPSQKVSEGDGESERSQYVKPSHGRIQSSKSSNFNVEVEFPAAERNANDSDPNATVVWSRCMSDKEGVQWKCYVKSWVKKLAYPEPVKEQLSNFFEKYCPPTLNWIRSLV